MSTLVSALKHEITRLARKEVAAGTEVLRKANALRIQQAIQPPQPLVSFFRSSNVEVISFFRQDDDWLGSHRRQEVGMVQIECQRARRALFRVLWQFVLHVAAKRRDETTRRSHRPPLFNAAQPCRHRAAT